MFGDRIHWFVAYSHILPDGAIFHAAHCFGTMAVMKPGGAKRRNVIDVAARLGRCR